MMHYRLRASLYIISFLPFLCSSIVSAYEGTYYADSFVGQGTSIGDTYTHDAFSAALCDLPLGKLAYVSSGGTGLVVKLNDRPNCSRYPEIIDFSRNTFGYFAPYGQGRIYDIQVTPLDVSLPVGYTKKFINASTFEDLGITLDQTIPNTYIKGETVRFSGKIINRQTRGVLYLKKDDGTTEILKGWDASKDGTFEVFTTLPETGSYTLILSSGNEFRTSLAETVYVIDDIDFSLIGLPLSGEQPLPKGGNRGDTFGITTDDTTWSRFTILQDMKQTVVSGRGFTIFPENTPLRSGKATLTTESYHLSTPFSIDRSSSLQKRTDTIIIDRNYPVDNKVGAKSQLFRKNILIQFTVPEGRKVKTDWYVTFPDGSVEKYSVPAILTQSGEGYIIPGKKIQLTVPARNLGTYLIETVDESGVAYFNIPIRVGPVWNILEPITDEMKSQIRKNLKLVKITSIQALNKLRATQNLSLIREDLTFSQIAQQKAEDMAKRGYLGHVSPEGKRIGDLFTDNNIEYTTVGENVAGGSIITATGASPISDMVLTDGLELSGSHRYNMLRPDWTKVGIGYASANGRSYYVQVFGK